MPNPTALKWDATGERFYETGIDRVALYPIDNNGAYKPGVAWNGVTSFTESPEGAEPTPLYADNIKYLNLMSAEDFKASIEAYTYPDAFAECDGSKQVVTGVKIGQQPRKKFGLAYRTKRGNDVAGDEYGYILHLVYGCLAAPSEKQFQTTNDSPEAIAFSWEISTTPVDVTGAKPTAHLEIDSTKVDASDLADLEAKLYGVYIDAPAFSTTSTYAVGDYVTYNNKVYKCTTAVSTAGAWDASDWQEQTVSEPELPLPDAVIAMFN